MRYLYINRQYTSYIIRYRLPILGIGIPHFIIESDGIPEINDSPSHLAASLTKLTNSSQPTTLQTTPILSTPTHDVSTSVSNLLTNQKLPPLDEVCTIYLGLILILLLFI